MSQSFRRLPSYADAAKQVRNSLRRFNTPSVISCALSRLHAHEQAFKSGDTRDLQAAPWITLLAAKLVLEDGMSLMRGMPNCPSAELDRCVQRLWEAAPPGLENTSEGRRTNLHLFVRSLLQVQLDFQTPVTWEFLRWPALIYALPGTHITYRHFGSELGMTPLAFMAICLTWRHSPHSPWRSNDGAFGNGRSHRKNYLRLESAR